MVTCYDGGEDRRRSGSFFRRAADFAGAKFPSVSKLEKVVARQQTQDALLDSGVNFNATPFMQYRKPVGFGPSSNT
jgi:hypothetical protein